MRFPNGFHEQLGTRMVVQNYNKFMGRRHSWCWRIWVTMPRKEIWDRGRGMQHWGRRRVDVKWTVTGPPTKTRARKKVTTSMKTNRSWEPSTNLYVYTPFTFTGTRAVSLVPTILDGTYIYKESSSNTRNYKFQTSRTEAMGVSASHGNLKMAIAIQPSSCFGSFLSCRQSLILSTVSYLVLLIIGESRKRPVISKGFLNYISVRSGAVPMALLLSSCTRDGVIWYYSSLRINIFLHHCVLKGSYTQLRGSTMICTFCHQLGDALLSHTTPNDLAWRSQTSDPRKNWRGEVEGWGKKICNEGGKPVTGFPESRVTQVYLSFSMNGQEVPGLSNCDTIPQKRMSD